MATTKDNRGIRYVCSGTATTTVNFDIELQAGASNNDDTTWLAGATTGYPGTLTPFEPRQIDGTNSSRSPRLIGLTMNAALTEGNTLTLSNDPTQDAGGAGITTILGVYTAKVDASASLGVTKTSALVLTFDVEATADGTTNDTSGAELLLIVV
jgi:hypothetical protein